MKTYQVFAARDGDTFRDTFEAADLEAAEWIGRNRAANHFGLTDQVVWAARSCDASLFDAELDGFSVEEEAQAHALPLATMQLYRRLADGLSDMVEEGRLCEGDIPDDYRWLVELLGEIAAADPGDQTPIVAIKAMHGGAKA